MGEVEEGVLQERIRYLEGRLKRLRHSNRNRKDRGQLEDELRRYVHDVINGSIQDCINQHGNQPLQVAKVSLLKRIQGQLCAPDVRRTLIEKILNCEREAIEEADDILSQGEEG